MTLALQPADDGELVRGQHLGDDVVVVGVDADLGGDGAGSAGVVTGQQHRGQAKTTQRANCLGAGRLRGVGDDQHRADYPVPGREHRGAAGGLSVLAGRLESVSYTHLTLPTIYSV